MARSIYRRCFLVVALLLLSGVSAGYAQQQDSLRLEQARGLVSEKKYKEAKILYDQIKSDVDSAFYKCYNQQVKQLYSQYQIDEQALYNNRQRSRNLLMILFTVLSLAIISLAALVVVRFRNRQLEFSREKLKEAQSLAEFSVKNKSMVLSNMSHDIRTPLTALSGFSSLLASEGIDERMAAQCNDIIQLNSELLLKLINDVIDISCLDIANLNFNIQECDAVALCRRITETMQKINKTSASITFECSQESCIVQTDAARLQQVIINLITNAMKFCQKGSIVLKLEKETRGGICVSVSDTGCGIPLEQQPKIFDRFEKLNENVNGTGLGLSICKLIMKRLNGDIWIDPDYTDGARFVFVHPEKQEVIR